MDHVLENQMINLLMPIAGRGSRVNQGVFKPFIDVDGEPLFQRALRCYLPKEPYHVMVVTRKPYGEAVEKVLEPWIPGQWECAEVPEILPGMTCSCMSFGNRLWGKELMVVVGDHLIEWDVDTFLGVARQHQSAVVTTKQKADLTKSYLNIDRYGTIAGVHIKEPTESEDAIFGAFYWRDGWDFWLWGMRTLASNDTYHGECYVDSMFNHCEGADVVCYDVPRKSVTFLGTDEEIEVWRHDCGLA
jgi:choline kinase